MEKITADICIIGAGSGGLSIAAGAAQMGARVVLVEIMGSKYPLTFYKAGYEILQREVFAHLLVA